ncbi:MAG: tetratricopeptide repeat protein [Chloroflexota bacterium]|nr:tetratricopeptide repeat protein [Chloroflexota bacterium]MDQ5865284.1 tetratricopeptide repeat protein [Chloroflexota bacterium]
MNPLGKRIVVLGMFWVFLVMIVTQVYDNVTGRGMPATRAAAPTPTASAQVDAVIQQMADLQACVANNPENLDCMLELATLYYDLEQYPQAQTAFEAAIKLDPHNVGALVKLAGSYIRQNKFPEAVTTLEQALDLQPDSPELHLLLGLSLSRLDPPQTDRAVAEWRQVISLDPNSALADQARLYIEETGQQP